jgi:hypothetical protein
MWYLRRAVPKTGSFANRKLPVCILIDFTLGYMDVTSLAQTISPSRILYNFHKLAQSHILVALQATNRPHHYFGAIHNVTINSISILLYAAIHCNGFNRSTDEETR